ncbi:MAG: vWA domain-containing protein [Candidatus Microsaccharimonas sp.]
MATSIEIIEPTIEDTELEKARIRERALTEARNFLETEAPILGKLTGLDANFSIGDGWATDLETGDFTIDPSFFVERDYTPEAAVYATLHELWAHVRDVQRHPKLAAEAVEFIRKGKAASIFDNIFSDIHGNKLMHAALPQMAEVASDLYRTKLFPDEKDGELIDYATAHPMHLQFVYAIMRQEMIPGSETPVRPEVQEAIDSLRDYRGQGDLIKMLTSPDSKMDRLEQFQYRNSIIYPIFKRLLEQDKKERKQNPGKGQPGKNGEPGQSSSGEPQGPTNPFAEDYKNYDDNIHPEPFTDEEHEKIEKIIRKNVEGKKPDGKDAVEKALDEELRKETGYGLKEHRKYKNEVIKNRTSITEMRDVFKTIISERVSLKRKISRRAYTEGVILDPDRLAQTVIDMKAGNNYPEAYKQYESTKGRAELVGSTDYFFVFDTSLSMDGECAEIAAGSSLIMLEGLTAVMRDVDDTEQQTGLDLEFQIRTSLYTFGNVSECIKPLADGLTDKERLDVFSKVSNPNGGYTNDHLALNAIAKIPTEPDRRRIVIVVTDGQSSYPQESIAAVRRLESQGAQVFGIGIGTEAGQFKNRQMITNPADLPAALKELIEKTTVA